VLDLAVNMAAEELRGRARLVKDYGEVPPVRGEERRLGQLALCLLLDAARRIPPGQPDGGELRILTRTDADGRAVVEVRSASEAQAGGAGAGLGLSAVRAMVHTLGGETSLESEAGKGSALRVVLPAVGLAPAAASGAPPVEAA